MQTNILVGLVTLITVITTVIIITMIRTIAIDTNIANTVIMMCMQETTSQVRS